MTIHIDIVAQLAEEISDNLYKLNSYADKLSGHADGFHFEVIREDGIWKIKGYKVQAGEVVYDPDSALVYEDWFTSSDALDAINSRLAGLLVYAKIASGSTVDTRYGNI